MRPPSPRNPPNPRKRSRPGSCRGMRFSNHKKNNLNKILSNMQEATGGGENAPTKPKEPSQPQEAKPARKLQVDEFIITGGKIHISVTGLVPGTAAAID